MRIIELEELKLIQLDVVQALHDFCVENNIKYSLACGSLLGAIRHNGYIPWDDDIDVYMEREDYERFAALFPKSYKGIYEFSCLDTDNEWNMPYGKLYDNRTIMLENIKGGPSIGINIDVFPVDAVPDSSKIWQNYNWIRKGLRDLFTYKTLVFSKTRPFWKNLVIFFSKIILLPFSNRFGACIINKYAQLFNGEKDANRLFENIQGIFQKQPFDKDDFSETILHKFEDRYLYVMKGYDHCLSSGFGDYMQLPPIEKRVSHHSFKAFWKESTIE